MDVEVAAPACTFCGLPCGAGRRDHEGAPFCCLGCVLACAVTGAQGDEGLARLAMARFTAGAFFAMNVMAFSLVLYGQDAGLAGAGAGGFYQAFRFLALAASVPVLGLLGPPLVAGLRDPGRAGARLTDALVLVSISAAWLFSLNSVVAGAGEVYFDAAAMTLLFLTLGRFLSARARATAGDTLRGLASALPRRAWVVDDAGAAHPRVLDEVRPGMVVRVRRGDAVPVDGVLRCAHATVDQAVVTGEADPALLARGEPLFAGSFNLGEDLDLEVTGAVGARMIEEMDRLLAEARGARTPFLSRTERVAGFFLRGVLVIAALTFAGWAWVAGPGPATLNALAVLLAACPCALGLAAPLAYWAGLCRAGRLGVAVLDGAALERLAGVDVVLFDKTGTLTTRRDPGAPRDRSRPEELRPGAREAVADLLALGLEVRILSGDTPERVAAIAGPLGVRGASGLLPTEKVALTRELAAARRVVFVGDGLNDAPALGAAQVGIALGDGTDLARSAADMVLLRDDLRRLPALLRVARETVAVQNRNLAWTFGYNSLLLVAAAAGRLHPALAAFFMVVSSLFVVTNSTAAFGREGAPPELAGEEAHELG